MGHHLQCSCLAKIDIALVLKYIGKAGQKRKMHGKTKHVKNLKKCNSAVVFLKFVRTSFLAK